MEENDLEEGEAFSNYENGDCVDPDVALSYIDEKLQNVLGHFQKDFEGVVSAENLGAKFGGYGSFLPSYPRSPPTLFQTPSIPQNHTISKSPYSSSVENPSVTRNTSISKDDTALVVQPINPGRNDNHTGSFSSWECVPKLDSSNKHVSNGDQKSLKVRIKVGPDNTVSQNNAAIYSGLGLDTPPSSSDDSLDASPGLSSAFQSAPGESPLSILQAMTCFSVPGGYLISPLHECLCQLTENDHQALFAKGMNLICKGDVAKTSKETDIANMTYNRIDLSALNTPLQSCSRDLDQKAERQLKGNWSKDSNRALKSSKLLNSSSEEDGLKLPNTAKSVKITGNGNSGNGTTKVNENHKSITSSAENNFGDSNPSNQKVVPADALGGGKGKNHKSNDDTSFNIYEHESEDDLVSEHGKPMKQLSSEKHDTQEKVAEEFIQRNEGKRRQKPSTNNWAPSIESFHAIESTKSSSSLASKEKKKDSLAYGSHSESKIKIAKSGSKNKKDHSSKSYRDQGAKHVRRTERSKERSEIMKDVIIQPEKIKSMPSNNLDAAVELIVPPVGVIEDNWVCCDICQKWRLLPHGQNPINLPKKWKCSMQDWLPGLNKCAVPEEETTKAFNALFVVPATDVNFNGHHDVIMSKNTSVEEHLHVHQTNTAEKKPWETTVASNLPKHSILDNQDATLKAKNSMDVNDYLFGRNSSANTFTGPTSEAMHTAGEYNHTEEKPEIHRRHLDEGHFSGKGHKHTESKQKRKINQDGFKSSKKYRKENSGFANKTPDNMSNGLSDVQYSDSLDYAAKKRKVKEWQESQDHQVKSQRPSESNHNAKEIHSEGEPRKKKSVVSRFEREESKMNELSGNMNIKGRFIQSLSSGNDSNRDLTYAHLPTTAASNFSKVSRSSNSKSRSRSKSKTNLHEARASPVESVSSSPLRNSTIEKSFDRKSFDSNRVVTVDHPVLASPKKLSSGEPCIGQSKFDKNYSEAAELKNIHIVGESENILNDDDDEYGFKRSNNDCIDGNQDNFKSPHQSTGNGKQMSNKSGYGFSGRNQNSNCDSGRDKLKASNCYTNKKEVYSTKHGSNCNEKSSKSQVLKDENDNFAVKDADELLEKTYSTEQSKFDRSDKHNYNESKNISDTRITYSTSKFQENGQQVPLSQSKNLVKREASPLKDKSAARDTGLKTVSPIKGSSSNSNAFKASKQSKHQNNAKQAVPSIRDPSPMRKDGHSRANAVIKEARDLKHTANRLKNEGLYHESNGLYFEAALKFLLGASLSEPSNEETNPSIQMMNLYSETAKFFEYCAFEYERHKEMAAAALAYKCAEVAYMKVAYYRHPAASKDRHELQAALQTAIPGESPSSSASDIDNLNNQSALDKAVLTKPSASPIVTGNHVIAARNRPTFTRLLAYTNDLNCAFDATKRSQVAIAAATASLDEGKVDGVLSVRKVLDFNFHNIEGLLRLVRVSMDLITT